MTPIGLTFAGTQYVSQQLLALLASPSVIALENRNDELPFSVDEVRESTVNCLHFDVIDRFEIDRVLSDVLYLDIEARLRSH